MGCDWHICVQALFKDSDGTKRWVTLNDCGLYTKTGCGGNPVRYVFRKFIEAGHANGSSGEEFPIVCDGFDTAYGEEHWCVESLLDELSGLNRTYDADGEVISKKQKTDNADKPASKKMEDYLDPEEVLKKRVELEGKVESVRAKIKERGFIGGRPEWEYFHLRISEYQGLCDALLESQFAFNYYDDYAQLLEWTDLLENFARDRPSPERVSQQSLGYIQYRESKGGKALEPSDLEDVRKDVKEWKGIIGDYKVALQMMPGVCEKIGSNDVGKTILGYCGRSSPLDIRFSVHCEEGHLEEYRKGNMKGAFDFDGSCCIM